MYFTSSRVYLTCRLRPPSNVPSQLLSQLILRHVNHFMYRCGQTNFKANCRIIFIVMNNNISYCCIHPFLLMTKRNMFQSLVFDNVWKLYWFRTRQTWFGQQQSVLCAIHWQNQALKHVSCYMIHQCEGA